MVIDNSSTAAPAHKRPTFADIEKRMGELLTQAGLHSRNSTSPASLDPDLPPTRALPTPEPLPISAPPHPSDELQPGEAAPSSLSVNPASHEPKPQPEPRPPLHQQSAPGPQQSLKSVFEKFALYGLAGQAVRTLAPHTEAQPEAILLQLLAAFGNVIGPGPHCIVELAESLHRTEAHNGFANRCLWAIAQRVQCLPDGGDLAPEDLSALAGGLRRAVDWAQVHPEILFRRDQAASELWNDYYASLSQDRPGLHGTATGRAEAQVLRLSAIYAALDCSSIIQLPHLHAALALWDYCSYSATTLFGTCVGDSIADRILEALRSADSGLTRKQIRDLFHGNISSSSIDQALEKLSSLGAAACRFTGAGRGRPATLWSAIGHEYAEPIEEETPEEFLSRRLSALVRTF